MTGTGSSSLTEQLQRGFHAFRITHATDSQVKPCLRQVTRYAQANAPTSACNQCYRFVRISHQPFFLVPKNV